LSGNTIRSEKPNKFSGSFFASVPLTKTATFGIGVVNSYGTSVFWPKDGPFKYFTGHEGQLKYFDFTPSIGIQASKNFRVGATLNVAYAQLSLSQLYPWSALTGTPLTSDGEMEFECEDVALGGTLGMSWDVTPEHHLTLVGRTPVRFRFEGRYEITNIPFPIPSVTRRSDLEARLNIPAELTLSYAWDLTRKLTLGAEFSYIFNSAVEDFRIDVGGNNVLFPSTTTQLGWNDSIAASIGAKYRLTPELSLLTGYRYTESPMEERNYTPLIPGIDGHLLSAGAAYVRGPVTLKVAYSKGFFPEMEIRSNTVAAFNGTHSLDLNIVTMSVGIQF
jgi:long-chain fatty acid transport protein